MRGSYNSPQKRYQLQKFKNYEINVKGTACWSGRRKYENIPEVAVTPWRRARRARRKTPRQAPAASGSPSSIASTCNCKQTETDIYRLIRTVTDRNGQKQTTSLHNVVSLQWKSDETLFQRSLTYCHLSLSLNRNCEADELANNSRQYNGNYQKEYFWKISAGA